MTTADGTPSHTQVLRGVHSAVPRHRVLRSVVHANAAAAHVQRPRRHRVLRPFLDPVCWQSRPVPSRPKHMRLSALRARPVCFAAQRQRRMFGPVAERSACAPCPRVGQGRWTEGAIGAEKGRGSGVGISKGCTTRIGYASCHGARARVRSYFFHFVVCCLTTTLSDTGVLSRNRLKVALPCIRSSMRWAASLTPTEGTKPVGCACLTAQGC